MRNSRLPSSLMMSRARTRSRTAAPLPTDVAQGSVRDGAVSPGNPQNFPDAALGTRTSSAKRSAQLVGVKLR